MQCHVRTQRPFSVTLSFLNHNRTFNPFQFLALQTNVADNKCELIGDHSVPAKYAPGWDLLVECGDGVLECMR